MFMSNKDVGVKQSVARFISFIIRKEFSFIISLILLFFIKERKKNGSNSLGIFSSRNKRTILALDSERYRSDLDILATSGEFRVLHIKQSIQTILMLSCYKEGVSILDIKKADINTNSELYLEHKASIELHKSVLKYLYKILGINIVLTVNYRYFPDYDWTLASESLGVRYIMLYRECLLNVPRIYESVVNRHSKFGIFHGTKIIVQNDICKKSFLDSGYVDEARIVVCGALRMDSLYSKINSNKIFNSEYNRFVLFYFPYNMSLFGKNGKTNEIKHKYAFNIWNGRERLFIDLHEAIIELANKYKNIEFIIKPKKEMTQGKSWEFYLNTVSQCNIDVNKLNNYKVLPDANVHDLILNSGVICALQSSTVLESAIARKRIVFPLFNKYSCSKNYADFGWSDNLDLFDVAYSKQSFIDLVELCLSNQNIDNNTMIKRESLFKKYFYKIDEGAINRYAKEIINAIQN
jgi:hypothetical protein